MAGSPYTSGQAGGGMNMTQVMAPDIYQQQLQLSRQQQFADLLKQQGAAGGHPTEVVNGWAVKQSPMEGLSRVLSAVGGQVMQSQIDQKNAGLAQALNQRMFGGGTPAQPVDAAPGQLGSGMSDAGNDPTAAQAVQSSGAPSVPAPTGQPSMPSSVTNPQPAPQQGGVAGNFFSLPGMDSRQVQMAMMLSPDATMKTLLESHAPTDISKMGSQAGMSDAEIKASNAAALFKATNTPPTRLGPNIYYDPRQGVVGVPSSAGPGTAIVNNNSGNPNVLPDWAIKTVPGGLAAVQNSAYAGAAGKAATEPLPGVNPDTGESAWTNKLSAAGGAMPPAPGTTTNGPFNNYTPAGAAPASAPKLAPFANPGVTAAASTLATTNANNYSSLQNLASTSSDRVNMLDNMTELAKGSTQFGPGWTERMDRISAINGHLPSGMAMGSDDMANAQVMQKYMSNLVQQNQKALGGTGTDQQMSMIMHGTPTPDMMNKAMVDVIPKLKAQELALQAKATAANDFMAQNNNNPAALNKFENTWRQNYDPRIYQMQQMAPADRAAFMAKQPDAAGLRTKAQTALTNGWVQ
jgi:hypothetical protein